MLSFSLVAEALTGLIYHRPSGENSMQLSTSTRSLKETTWRKKAGQWKKKAGQWKKRKSDMTIVILKFKVTFLGICLFVYSSGVAHDD